MLFYMLYALHDLLHMIDIANSPSITRCMFVFVLVGGLASGPEANFENLPHKSILTLNVRPPEGWLVESVRAVYDLDNIKLEQVCRTCSIIERG